MQEIKVFCVNVGDKYSSEYVYRLKASVKRHLSLNHSFSVYTDRPEDYPGIGIMAEHSLDSWWNKILIFENTGQCLYFDLDTVIHGPLDSLVRDDFHMIFPYWKDPQASKILLDRPDIGTAFANSSVMAWNDSRHILKHFLEDPDLYMLKYGGDDRYLHHEHEYKVFEDGLIYSYRCNNFKIKEDYSVAMFHQKPEIHECLEHDIVKQHWL
jgi:hypothetical protein